MLRPRRTMHIVTIRALNQTLIHAMVERHLELRFLLQVTGVAESWLRFHQKKLFRLSMVR